MKWIIEIMDHFIPYQFPFGDFIKFQLHIGSEIIIQDIDKILHQEVVDQVTDIRRVKLGFFKACIFRFHFFNKRPAFQFDQ